MKKVLVVGSGPAGLAAAERLLDHGGVEVTIATLGHILGGKACSWRDLDGRVVEHGQHVMVGFYDAMRALLTRSGVDVDATSHRNGGKFLIYEDRDAATHYGQLSASVPTLLASGLGYSGFTPGEKANLLAFILANGPSIGLGVPESCDDLCFSSWCLARGLAPSLLRTNAFRAGREAQMNWPGEVSAYVMGRTLSVGARDATTMEVAVPRGGMSEIWWGPVADRIVALGGIVERYKKLVGVAWDGDRVTGGIFAQPIPHPPTHPYTDRSPETVPGSGQAWSGFDATILTLPPPALAPLIEADAALSAIPALAAVSRLTSVAPLALQIWHRNRTTARWPTIVGGLAEPLGFVVDNKAVYPELADDDRYGSVLHFAGQETGYEDVPDEEILDIAIRSLARVEGFETIDREGVLDWRLLRHRAPHKRYWNAEPGSLQWRPHSKTEVPGLYLAGDWVRSELDFPCMESAIRSGREAAGHVLAEVG